MPTLVKHPVVSFPTLDTRRGTSRLTVSLKASIVEGSTFKLMIIYNLNNKIIIRLLFYKALTLSKAWYNSRIGIVRAVTKFGGAHL